MNSLIIKSPQCFGLLWVDREGPQTFIPAVNSHLISQGFGDVAELG